MYTVQFLLFSVRFGIVFHHYDIYIVQFLLFCIEYDITQLSISVYEMDSSNNERLCLPFLLTVLTQQGGLSHFLAAVRQQEGWVV